MKITLAQAQSFYAQAFALCHSPNQTDGRRVNVPASNTPISTAFHITTPHGLLEVDVVLPEWRSLGFSVHMRFRGRPDIFPEVGGLLYDKFTGKWGLYGDDPRSILAELAQRLDWAQGIGAFKVAA